MFDKTRLDMAVLVKYLLGPIWLIPCLVFGRSVPEYPARLILIFPMFLIGLLCLTSAEVHATQETLKYRRFVSWVSIPYERIMRCGNSWIPWLGYLSLDRFVLPFGKIYFVKLRPLFSGDPRGLLDSINSRRLEARIEHHEEGSAKQNQSKGTWLMVLLGMVGVIVAMMYAYLTPTYNGQTDTGNLHGVAAAYLKFLDVAVSWPWASVTVLIMIAAIIRYRSKKTVWILALAAGTVVGNVIASAIR